MTSRQASQTLRHGRPALAALLALAVAFPAITVPALAQTRDPQPAPRDRGGEQGSDSGVRVDPMSVIDALRRAEERERERQRRRRETEAREAAERERLAAEQAAADERAAIAREREEAEAAARRERDAERVAAQAAADAAAKRRAQRPPPRPAPRTRPVEQTAPPPVEPTAPVVAAEPTPAPLPPPAPASTPTPPRLPAPNPGPSLGSILVWLAAGAALLIAAVAVRRVMLAAFGPRPRAVARPDPGEVSAPEGLKPPAATARANRGAFDSEIDYPTPGAAEIP